MGLTEWRQNYGEIVNLVELAIELPGQLPVTDFEPYVVTNGEVTDPVLEQVRVANLSWRGRGLLRELQIVQKRELLDRFFASHGAYLPRDLADFRSFLELILHDGAAPADKEKMAQLIEHVCPGKPESETPINVARSAASLVLLTAYVSGPADLASNHWSVFEYWVLAGAYVLYLAQKCGAASFELCEQAAKNALDALTSECSVAPHLVQGFPLLDGHTYRARIAILAGLLSARDLYIRVRRRARQDIGGADAFTRKYLRDARLWGESGVPYLFLAALESECNCGSSLRND